MGAIAYKGKIYGGGGSVEDLTDANVTDVADGDILEYDSTAEKWKNSNALSGKVDKETGKGLSTNDYTTAEKDLVATIPDKADSDDISGAKSASGNPLIIEDSANAYAEEMIANIEPIQDLHGYDHPWVGGAGKNLLPMTVEGIKAANTDGSWSGNTYTYRGVTVEILTDNYNNIIGYDVDGTASGGNLEFRLIPNSPNTYLNKIINGSPASSGYEVGFLISMFDGTTWKGEQFSYNQADNVLSINQPNIIISLFVKSGSTASHKKFYPMVRDASETDASFAPYTNISLITGITQLDIDGCGKNFVEETLTEFAITSSGLITPDSNRAFDMQIAKIRKGETYTITTNDIFCVGYFAQKPANGVYSYDGERHVNSTLRTFVAPIDGYVAFRTSTGYATPQIELGSTATSYEPYTPNNHTLPLGRTVYGGKLNVQTGELVVNRAFIELDNIASSIKYNSGTNCWIVSVTETPKSYGSDGIPQNMISSVGYNPQSYNSDKSQNAMGVDLWGSVFVGNGSSTTKPIGQICYELATPITYHLTPEQVKLLKGYNYITTNADTLDIIYQPDNVLGEILGEAEGYTDRAIKAIDNKANPITHNIDISSYTDDSNPYVAPEDGYVQLRFTSDGTGYIWLKIGYSRSSEARYDVTKYFRKSSEGDDWDAIFVKKGTYICLSSIQSYTNGYVYFRY